MAIAAYNGLFFGTLSQQLDDEDQLIMILSKERYFEGQFVNKVVEYEKDQFICAIWDTKFFEIISRKDKTRIFTISHPNMEPFKCWGL